LFRLHGLNQNKNRSLRFGNLVTEPASLADSNATSGFKFNAVNARFPGAGEDYKARNRNLRRQTMLTAFYAMLGAGFLVLSADYPMLAAGF
jgi:hypothetical protein